MNFKDSYENEEHAVEFKFISNDEENISDMDSYIKSSEHLHEQVFNIYKTDLSDANKCALIKELRRTSYLANSSYYPEVFNLSLSKTRLPEFILDCKKSIKLNTKYLKKLGVKLKKTSEGYDVFLGSTLIVRAEEFSPDRILNIYKISADTQMDYHILAGYLLSAENSKLIQLALSMDLTINVLETL